MSVDSIPATMGTGTDIAGAANPRVARLLAANVALQLGGMLSGQLLAFDAAVHLAPSQVAWGAWMVGLVGAAFNVTRLLAVPIAGRLCDTRGAERVLLASPILGSAAVMAAASMALLGIRGVAGVSMLVLARLVEGASAACAIPAMLTLLSRATEGRPEARTRVMGMFEITALTGLVGAMLSASLLWERFDTHSLVVLAPLYVLAIPLLAAGARTPPPAHAASGEHADSMLVALRRLFSQRRHIVFAVVWIVTNALVGLWLQYMPYVLMLSARSPTQRLVGSLNGSGTTLVLAGVGTLYVVGTALWSWAGARVARTRMLGTAISATIVMAVVLAAVNHGAPRGLHVVTAICLLLQGGITPAALSLLADLTGDEDRSRGTAMGLFSFLLGIGQFIGVLLGAPAVAHWQLDGLLGLTAVFAALGLAGLGVMAKGRVGESARAATPGFMPPGNALR